MARYRRASGRAAKVEGLEGRVLLAGGSGLFPGRAEHYGVGWHPFSVAAADLDGDGDIDLATADEQDSELSLLMNKGNGTFAPEVRTWAGVSPMSVVAADLDADGDQDLVTTGLYDYGLYVLRNNGNGTFAFPELYESYTNPVSVAAVDVDGDGSIDLVTANDATSDVSVLMNSGRGTFAAGVHYAVYGSPMSVVPADLDGDGDADLLVGLGGGVVSILVNSGDGSFALSDMSYGIGSGVAAADMDGDGDIDLAAAHYIGHMVSVMANDGHGGFADMVAYEVGNHPSAIAAVDIDRDGDVDLVAANYYSDDVSVLLNNGDGTFANQTRYAAGDGPGAIVAADIDGDGDADLITASTDGNYVSVLRNQGNRPPTDLALSGTTIAENQPSGTPVGTLGTTDPDSVEPFTYTLVSGTGSDDNASFSISGNTLRTGASFDYEVKNRYSVRVRSTDQGGLWVERTFMIGVTDVDEVAPSVTSASINGGAIQRSMVTGLSVVFSEPVSLSAGAMRLQLKDGTLPTNTMVSVANPSGDQKTYALTFSGSGVIGGSLADGVYDLVVVATGVQDLAGNVMTANYTQRFHRLFGDSDGNRIVNALDYARLKQSFGRAPSDPLFNGSFDYENNGLINALDLARFRQRYGMSFSY